MSRNSVILLCICLIISDLQHLFLCLLTMCMSSGKESSWVSCHFVTGCLLMLFSAVNRVSAFETPPCWSHLLGVFSPCLSVVFSFCLIFPFALQMHLSGPHLFIFVYIFLILRNRSKDILWFYVPECHACVFSGVLWCLISHLGLSSTLSSFLVYHVKEWSNCFFSL